MNKNKLINAINNFKHLNILVIGDVMLDVYDFCYTKFSKPLTSEKEDKRAYIIQKSILTLGGAGNVASNLSALNAKTSIIGVCGDDSHYFTLNSYADKQKINHFFVRDSERITTLKNRIYLDDEYLLRKDHEVVKKISEKISEVIVREFYKLVEGLDAVVLSDYSKGLFTEHNCRNIIEKCEDLKIPIVVDFKPDNKELFRGATIMSPNFYEAKEVCPEFEINKNLPASTKKIASLLGCEKVVITLHDRGVCGYDGKNFFHIQANKVEEVDAVGCGDTARALLVLCTASGLDLHESANIANDASGIVVTKPATSIITPHELTDFIKEKY